MAGRQPIQICFLELRKYFSLNIFDMWLIESMTAELMATEGQPYVFSEEPGNQHMASTLYLTSPICFLRAATSRTLGFLKLPKPGRGLGSERELI